MQLDLRHFIFLISFMTLGCSRSQVGDIAQHKPNRLPPRLERAISNMQDAELVSLEPWADPSFPGQRLGGRLVLGATRLSSSDRRIAVSEVKEDIAAWSGAGAACFDPRHAVRGESSGHTYAVLICYSCQEAIVLEDGREVASVGVTGDAAAFNKILAAANVPISHSEEELEARYEREFAKRAARAVQAPKLN
jgi:hypothetical protein